MKNGHWFIALEGLSGVGKSSVARLLAERLDAELVKTPAPPFQQIRHAVDRAPITPWARYFFYLAGTIEASACIALLLKHHHVVCDRYILTTVCYHRALGLATPAVPEETDILWPDLTVLLTCTEEIRLARLNERGWSRNDWNEEVAGIGQRFEQEYLKHPVFRLDTTWMTPPEVVDKILARLFRREGHRQSGSDNKILSLQVQGG